MSSWSPAVWGRPKTTSRGTRSRAPCRCRSTSTSRSSERIRERFARRGMTMPEINRRQAMVPRGATVLPNPNGTAPGLWIEQGRSAIVLLPGPPREMKPMFEAVVRERLTRAQRRRRAVQAGAAHHRSHRIGRRYARAAGVRSVGVASGPDQHDDSGGPRSNRAAPDGARRQPRRSRRGARRGGPATARRARRFDLQRSTVDNSRRSSARCSGRRA